MPNFENLDIGPQGVNENITENVGEDRREEYEAAGLTQEEQEVYNRYFANVTKFAEEISTWRGVLKYGVKGLIGKEQALYTDEEEAVIKSANDKLLKFQNGGESAA